MRLLCHLGAGSGCGRVALLGGCAVVAWLWLALPQGPTALLRSDEQGDGSWRAVITGGRTTSIAHVFWDIGMLHRHPANRLHNEQHHFAGPCVRVYCSGTTARTSQVVHHVPRRQRRRKLDG